MIFLEGIIKTLKSIFGQKARHRPEPRKVKASAGKKRSVLKSSGRKRNIQNPVEKRRNGIQKKDAKKKTNKKKQDIARLKTKKNARQKVAASKTSLKKRVKGTKLVPAVDKIEKSKEKLVGEITHYFSKIQVVVLKVTGVPVKIGDRVRFVGNSGEFVQTVESLQIESENVKMAKRGDLVGLKVKREAKVNDLVYLVL